MKVVTITAEPSAQVALEAFAFDLATSPMLVVASDGLLSTWNQAAIKLLDPKKAGLMQTSTEVHQLFEMRSSSLLTDILLSAGGTPLSVTLDTGQRKTKPDKRSLTVKPIKGQGCMHFLLIIGKEIPIMSSFRRLSSELKETNARAAAQREYAKVMELKNKELEQFSISTAHDLKAPLIQVQMLLQLFIEDYGTELHSDGKDLVGKACTSVDNLRTMIDDLLGEARRESTQLADQSIDLDKSVAKVISGMDALLASIDAKVTVPENLGVVMGNDIKFQQVMSNLLSNAIKYRSEERQLSISIEVDKTENAPFQLRIRDNGIGFETDKAQSLFKPFTRLEKGDNAEGHGIGLSTCQQVCDQLGWTLNATGAPEQGAEFRVIFDAPSKHVKTANG